MDVEEEGLGKVESVKDGPESSRIQRTKAAAHVEERLVHLRCVIGNQSKSSESVAEKITGNQ